LLLTLALRPSPLTSLLLLEVGVVVDSLEVAAVQEDTEHLLELAEAVRLLNPL
jgi:hypothetical protein